MDVAKQIEYWRVGSVEDLDAAKSMLDRGHIRHALFFAHLALEKAIKAHVVKATRETPPKMHNLVRLADIATLSLSDDTRSFLEAFNVFQLEGRYPDVAQAVVDKKSARERMAKAEEVHQWLMSQL
jgi:HEPN domain-containing protein